MADTSTHIKAWNMQHTIFSEVFYLRQLFCVMTFLNAVAETTAAHFFKKVWWLS